MVVAINACVVGRVEMEEKELLREGENASNDGHQDCLIDHFVCKKSVDEIWHPRSSLNLHLNFRVCISFCPFVVPRWMEPVPRPPQAEMIDMTSLLSYATATHERMMGYMNTVMRDKDNDYFWME
ncbi:hypothetical protein DY000_02018396 [Brassica cretica]|uniref:F-box protein At3g26010-like beta-propeller domain-containing protein n=1 Tax=Brassica cretica TaxID=69181 RepID=A0ABQ7D3Y8_BRACR|nr:hypothetical protein DY000_02018396 [Brassica cretica]